MFSRLDCIFVDDWFSQKDQALPVKLIRKADILQGKMTINTPVGVLTGIIRGLFP